MTHKPDFPEQERAIDAVETAAREYLSAYESPRPSYDTFLSERGLYAADSYVEQGFMPAETSAELLEINVEALHGLLEEALTDTEHLYEGIHAFLQGQGYAEQDILAIAQRSRPLAHSFGSILPNRAHRLGLLAKEGQAIFAVGADGENMPVVEFTAEAREKYIKPYRGRDIGCPILAMTVEAPHVPERVNLYDLHWEAFCAQAHTELTASR